MRQIQIWHVILLALALRLGLAIAGYFAIGDNTAFHSFDTGSYIEIARQLALSGTFVDANGQPEIVRTPGYPLFMAVGVLLGNVEVVTVALQIAVSLATVYLIYRTSLLLFDSERAALLAAFLYAIEPLSILYATKVMSETLFTALLALFLYAIVRYFKENSLPWLILSAVALAGSAYVRPIILYFPLVMTLILVIRAIVRRRRWLAQAAAAALFFVVAVGLPGLWQVRNATQANYNGFSAISDISWYFYQGASVEAARQGLTYYALWDEMGYTDREQYLSNHPEQRNWPEGDIYEYMGAEGRRVVLDGLSVYVPIHLIGIVKTVVNPGGVEYLKMLNLYSGDEFGEAVNQGFAESITYLLTENPLLLFTNVLFGVMLAAYLALSLVALFARRHTLFTAPMLTLLALGAYLLVMSGGPQSLSRFRHPIMPILCLLAGFGLSVIMEASRRRRENAVGKN